MSAGRNDPRKFARRDTHASLDELLSSFLGARPPIALQTRAPRPWMGTMPGCEERFGHSRLALFLLSALRGAGQAVFANSPLAGLLILIALASQSGWLFVMALLGLVSSTLTSRLLGLDTAARCNGLYGYNGLLIGAALATFGVVSNSPWQLPAWCLISVTFSPTGANPLPIPALWGTGNLLRRKKGRLNFLSAGPFARDSERFVIRLLIGGIKKPR